ncbi:aminotransferase class V-fold PLP-dependent enzyme [Sulfolobus acidocaldarius]|uniref:Selenocysteine lyase n=4 Tax=Sulfolobus acidocaldarius TaxID=2285 RepID=Q4JCM5_SULAC|nr:aminotransferase class V-fold PLP-dependent enzyme [Sulfolobus acidocaldarius]AAY79454.1 selenocysteine lyase [Sulfolobus acidocaldarius DSM 639]AGE70004.1 selenocysteine lyase [Sulfolobus acidocaldarius N8]AGE72279.1 selenocysteine lyase [Sulfolobus acidocaldarius Ron12/I]ALU29566.1 cysteine desulfurase [Sulfolobus acidocaldarius]ALU32296.1 cysteine desulfurase [Sulfolobus acidocaldarius]
MTFVEDFRELVPITKRMTYLNHAAISPTPLPVYFEANRYLIDVMRYGSLADNDEESDELYHIRKNIGSLINAEADEISLIPNTSFGVNVISFGLDIKEGENIVTDNLEFPTVVYPFLKLEKKGVKIKLVKTKPDTIEEDLLSAIDTRTRLVAVSHVSFNTGVMVDVKKIVKEVKSVGGFTLLDIIQSAGAIKVDVKDLGVDFAVAGGYKWLMSPQGSGFIYVRKGLISDPPFYGWKSTKNYLEFNPEKFEIEPGPRRFEIGTIDIAANLGLAKSCEIIRKHEEETYSSVQNLSDYVIKLAEENRLDVITPKKRKAGISIIRVNNAKQVVQKLLEKHIVVSARGEGIRISTHFYNTKREVEILIEEMKKILQQAS